MTESNHRGGGVDLGKVKPQGDQSVFGPVHKTCVNDLDVERSVERVIFGLCLISLLDDQSKNKLTDAWRPSIDEQTARSG